MFFFSAEMCVTWTISGLRVFRSQLCVDLNAHESMNKAVLQPINCKAPLKIIVFIKWPTTAADTYIKYHEQNIIRCEPCVKWNDTEGNSTFPITLKVDAANIRPSCISHSSVSIFRDTR
jgi:hypothetical protein